MTPFERSRGLNLEKKKGADKLLLLLPFNIDALKKKKKTLE